MLKKTSFIPNNVCISDLIRHFILAWLLAAAAEYFFLPGELRGLADLDGLAQMSFVRFVGMTGGIAVLLTGISFFVNLQRAERWCIAAVFGLLAAASLSASGTWPFLAVCVFVLALLVFYCVRGWNKRPEPAAKPVKAHKACLWITLGLTAAFFLFAAAWTVGRVTVSAHRPSISAFSLKCFII